MIRFQKRNGLLQHVALVWQLIAGIILFSPFALSANEVVFTLPYDAAGHPGLKHRLQLQIDKALAARDSSLRLKVQDASIWQNYHQKLRAGDAGVYLVESHFAAWLATRHKFQRLLSLSEKLSYSIIAERTQWEIFEVADLAGKNLCLPPPLSRPYFILQTLFTENLETPVPIFDWQPHRRTLESDSNCDAIFVTDAIALELQQRFPNKYIRLFHSKPSGNLEVVATTTLNASQLEEITQVLTAIEVSEQLTPLLKEYSRQPLLVKQDMLDEFDELGALNGLWQTEPLSE